MEQKITHPSGTRVLLTPLPLVLDLDGTLIRTDTFHEMVRRLFYQKPWRLLALPFWFLKGRAFAKARLVEETDLNPARLAYNLHVLNFARAEAETGRPLILATGTNQKIAREIADYVGIFQEVIGSNDHLNMTGMNKKNALTERFGEGGFDYAGDSHKDLHIWEVARCALVVSPQWGVLKKLHALRGPEDIMHFPREMSRVWALFLGLRPLFWLCNLGVPSLSLFVALCALTSGLLIVGDLVTLDQERGGSVKKSVFAEGHLHLTTAFLLASFLTVLPLVLFPFLCVLLPFFVATDLGTRKASQPLRWGLLSLIYLLSLHLFLI